MKGIVIHDFYSGILCKWKHALIVVFIYIAGCILVVQSSKNMQDFGNMTFQEIWLGIILGCKPLMSLPIEERTMIPIVWLTLQVYLTYIIGEYPMKDLEKYGTNLIIRTTKKARWWMSKCIWGMVVTILYYLIGVITGIVAMFITKGKVLGIHELYDEMCNGYFTQISTLKFVLIAFILPITASMLMVAIQMMCMTFMKEIVGYVICVVSMVGAIYYDIPLFYMRNVMATRTVEVQSISELIIRTVIMCILIFVTMFSGRFIFVKIKAYL